jgi:hypothetical protein
MKETYYTLENNTLRKVGSVIRTAKGYITNPTAEDCAAIGAYPRSDESFAPPKCDEGYHAVPDGYELVEELGVGSDGVDSPTPSLTHSITKKWVRKWRIEKLPPPPPRVFSKFKVVRLLTEMGIWLKVRDYIVAKGLYDLFLAAQDFKEDDQFFIEGLTSLKGELGLADEQIEDILKNCEV